MKNKTKVLFIMHMPPPVHGAAMMGQYIHDSKLINDQFECHYVNPSLSDTVADVGKVSWRKIRGMISNIIHIVRTLKKVNPDICYYTPTADGWGIYRDWMVVNLLRKGKRKVILHLHNKGVGSFAKRHFFARLAYKRIFRNVKVILLSRELYSDVRQYVPLTNVYYCPNGMPQTDDGSFVRTTTHQPFTFLFLSNMIEEKGVVDLLEACSILKGCHMPFRCNFVGRWSTVSEEVFHRILDEKDLNFEIFYLGPKYGKEKVKVLKDADALVFPTYYHGETFGLVLLEAMEYALPCISTREGGIPSVVDDGDSGFLISKRDVHALADKMGWLIEHPEEGIKMGKKGKEKFVRQFTLQTFEQRIFQILNSLC